MPTPIVVVYEDKPAPGLGGAPSQPSNHGLHQLVAEAVATKKACLRHAVLARVEAMPVGSNGDVVAKVQEDLRDWQHVLVVLDADEVRGLAGLDSGASLLEVASVLASRWTRPSSVFFFLEDNVETVLEAARECGVAAGGEVLEQAIQRKQRLARDQVLTRAAGNPAVLACVLARIPMLSQLRDALLQLI